MVIRDDPTQPQPKRLGPTATSPDSQASSRGCRFITPITRPTDLPESLELNDRTAYVAQAVQKDCRRSDDSNDIMRLRFEKLKTMDF